MIILASLMFLSILVYLIGSNITYKKDIEYLKKENEKNKNSTKAAFKQMSGILNNNGKIVKLIQKVEASVSNDIHNIIHDLDDLYKFSAKQTETIKNVMKKHNEFVNETMDNIRDLHCDLNDNDCSTCEYHDYCIADGLNDENEGISFSDLKDNNIDEDDSPVASCHDQNQMTIDPTIKGAFNKLEKAMCKSGVPKEVVDNYLAYIKKTCLASVPYIADKKIEVVWIFGNNSEAGVIKHKFIKKEDDTEKLVDPHAKIVKTLNKLYDKE